MRVAKREKDRRALIAEFRLEVSKIALRMELTDTEVVAALSETSNNMIQRSLNEELRGKEEN